MSSDGWMRYAEYARKLDEVRTTEAARTEGMRQAVAEMTTHADELEARLNGQGGMLLNLAPTLRLRRPKLVPIVPEGEGVMAPAPGLRLIGQAIDRGDTDARQAAERGQFPSLLPGMKATARAVVVYGVAALLVLLLQALSFARDGKDTNPIMVLFLIPLVGFAIAYVVLSVGSRTRMTTKTPELRTRLGFLLCFGIGPLAAVAVIATSVKPK